MFFPLNLTDFGAAREFQCDPFGVQNGALIVSVSISKNFDGSCDVTKTPAFDFDVPLFPKTQKNAKCTISNAQWCLFAKNEDFFSE